MALELVQPGLNPLGQFDGKDDVYLTVLGGEVATITSVSLTAGDKAAKDADGTDGYVGTTRPVVTTALTTGARPLFLVDDGVAGYGTIFGSVVGGVAGQVVTGGAQLGPHTATGSGKLTLWDKPGTYAVTLDAVDTDATDGLVPTNTGLTIGAALYATSAGKLTPDSTSSFEASVVVGRFLNFETNKGGSLVNTPVFLASSSAVLNVTRALIYFAPPIA